MSRERARRRQEREALLEQQRAARAREVARRSRRRAVVATLRRPFSVVRRPRRPGSALRRARVRQDAWLAGVLLAANVLVWIVSPSWVLRGVVAALCVLAWPLLVVLAFDRRRL